MDADDRRLIDKKFSCSTSPTVDAICFAEKRTACGIISAESKTRETVKLATLCRFRSERRYTSSTKSNQSDYETPGRFVTQQISMQCRPEVPFWPPRRRWVY